MYVYIKSEQYLWTVGFYDPSGEWHPESDHESREAAANRCAFLNGNKRVSNSFAAAYASEEAFRIAMSGE